MTCRPGRTGQDAGCISIVRAGFILKPGCRAPRRRYRPKDEVVAGRIERSLPHRRSGSWISIIGCLIGAPARRQGRAQSARNARIRSTRTVQSRGRPGNFVSALRMGRLFSPGSRVFISTSARAAASPAAPGNNVAEVPDGRSAKVVVHQRGPEQAAAATRFRSQHLAPVNALRTDVLAASPPRGGRGNGHTSRERPRGPRHWPRRTTNRSGRGIARVPAAPEVENRLSSRVTGSFAGRDKREMPARRFGKPGPRVIRALPLPFASM